MNPLPPLRICAPSAPLQAYISHYWLAYDNRDDRYAIMPDGAVDVVVSIDATAVQTHAFGSTTQKSLIALKRGAHYVGIRFRPGQSRHFLAAKACELTNCMQPAADIFAPDITDLAERVRSDSLFAYLDASLLRYLQQRPPHHSRIDAIIEYIETTQEIVRIANLAALYGKSCRQFERNFLDAVGLPAKLFSEIIRCQRTATLLRSSKQPIAHIAAAMGYADQSHFNHELSRFFGMTPQQFRQDVAFLQDAQ